MRATLIHAALVGLGGFAGVLGRYGLSELVQRQWPFATFPYGTLAVNLAGCLAIGMLAGIGESKQVFTPEFRVFAFIGVLGGFTTFSTFGYETFAMIRDAEYLRASANLAAHVGFGLVLVWLGYSAAAWR